MTQSMPFVDARDICVWTEDIPKRFLDLLKLADPLAIYISSPWISEFTEPSMNFLDILKRKNASTIILTQPPKGETRRFLKKLTQETKTRVYVSNRLHAKIYIIEGIKHRYVILGSSNLTQEARGNIEIAVAISGSDIITKRVIYSYHYLKLMCRLWE